jgi:hypothetical protein
MKPFSWYSATDWVPNFQYFWKVIMLLKKKRSRVSSVSIVSDYGLDDRAIEVRSPAEARGSSSSLCVQTGSGGHPASCTMGNVYPFPGGRARPGRDADHSSPSSAEVMNELKLYLLSPQASPWRVVGLLYLLKNKRITPYVCTRKSIDISMHQYKLTFNIWQEFSKFTIILI